MNELIGNMQQVCSKYTYLINRLEDNKKKIACLESDLNLFSNTKQLLMEFSEKTRAIVKNKLESLANSGLSCIFTDKDVKFKIIPNQTKKILYYDLYITTDGNLTPLDDAKGGGILDIITMALRISFVRMLNAQLRQTILFDEPFKNLDKVRSIVAVEWLTQISKEFNMQFIIVTHKESIMEKADKVIRFINVDGVTIIE